MFARIRSNSVASLTQKRAPIILTTYKGDFLANKLTKGIWEMILTNRKYFFICFENGISEVSVLLPNYPTMNKIVSVYFTFALIPGRLWV